MVVAYIRTATHQQKEINMNTAKTSPEQIVIAFDANTPNNCRKTVGDLIDFLSVLPREALLGVWVHEGDGAGLLGNLEVSLERFEYRKYPDMKDWQYGNQWLLANLKIEPEYDEDDDEDVDD